MIFFAHAFDGQGGSTPLTGEAIGKALHDEQLAWVHLDGNHPDTPAWLEAELAYLDSHITGALLAQETRPRITRIGNGFLIILRGVNLNKNADPDDMVSVRLWIDPHRIISVRRRKVRALQDIDERLRHGTGPKHSGDFITQLISRLSERMRPVIDGLDDETDAVEEKMLTSETQTQLREEIVEIRMQAIMFRRYMVPQRDVIQELEQIDLDWLSPENRRTLQEEWQHVSRYVEDLEAIRERAQIVKDELASIIADRLNKNMYVLSVIAAIFLPLGFLTGLLGINVGGIPGAGDSRSFVIFCGILVAVVVAQVALFKKMKWF